MAAVPSSVITAAFKICLRKASEQGSEHGAIRARPALYESPPFATGLFHAALVGVQFHRVEGAWASDVRAGGRSVSAPGSGLRPRFWSDIGCTAWPLP